MKPEAIADKNIAARLIRHEWLSNPLRHRPTSCSHDCGDHVSQFVPIFAAVSGYWLIILVLSVGANSVPAQQTPLTQATLTIDDVIRLVKTGVSEEVIVARIKRHAKPFDLTAEEVAELRREGIPDTILKYLTDPSLPYAAPTPPAKPIPPPAVTAPPPAPKKKYPEDKLAPKVPPEPGAYLVNGGEFLKTEVRTLMTAKSGGFGKRVTAGLLRIKITGQLIGQKAKARAGVSPVFYIRLENGSIDDMVLLSLTVKGDRRELDMAGDEKKPLLNVASMRPHESLEVDSKLFRITTSALTKGEYFFYLVGSGDPQKGIQGKGYDFGID